MTSSTSPDTSRRSFLRRFAGTATVAATTPLLAAAVSGDLYVNHRIGLAFRKPPTWRYLHLRTFADIRDEYEYATPDPALAAELKQGQLPVVVVTQAATLRDLGSSATVYVEENPLEPGETPAAAVTDLIRGISTFVKDFRLLDEPVIDRVADRNAVEFRFTFHYQDRLGYSGPVRHRTLVVLNAPLLFTFNMLDIPADNRDSQAEFDALRDSVVLA